MVGFCALGDPSAPGLEGVVCCLDDILVTAMTRSDHLSRLEDVLRRSQEYDLRVRQNKCEFLQTKVEYLGHLVDAEGLHPTEDKLSYKCYRSFIISRNVTILCTVLAKYLYYIQSIK